MASEFTARLHHVDEKKPEIPNEKTAGKIARRDRERAKAAQGGKAVSGAIGVFPVTEVKRRERRKNPAAPFTTSTLQQEAAKKLGFGSKRTMRAGAGPLRGRRPRADEGAVGTHHLHAHRLHARLADAAADQARDYLRTLFGKEFLAATPQLYRRWEGEEHAGRARSRASDRSHAAAGDAEAVPERRPVQALPAHLEAVHGVADGAGGVRHDDGGFTSTSGSATCSAPPGSIVKFQGFLALYREAREEGEAKRARGRAGAPRCSTLGERVPVREITPSQHFTEPPPRFSEASLVKELERLGIGRPSTYASIISDARRSPLRAARAAAILPHRAG